MTDNLDTPDNLAPRRHSESVEFNKRRWSRYASVKPGRPKSDAVKLHGTDSLMSAMSRELYNDVVQFEQRLERLTSSMLLSDAAGTSTQEQDAKRSSKFTSPAANTPNQEQPKQKNDVKTTLPPDDHGAVAKTTKINAEKEEKPENKSPTKPQTDLKYYASEAQKKSMAAEAEKKEKTYIPPLKLQTEKTTKTDKTSTNNTKKEQTAHESPRKSERSKTVEISRTPTTDYSDRSRKRKEVTIIDPAEVRKVKYTDGDEEDTFPKEFEYREPGERRTKKFEEMTDEEKVDYFRHQLKIRPDQIRELTFHPKVTAPKQIHRAYTGVDTVGWASSPRQLSARRPKSRYNKGVYKKIQSVLPHKRKSFMFSRLQGVVYRHINNVYGQSPRENREKQFLEKLAQVQIEEYERRYQMLEQRERKRLESKFKQREQLKQLRRRFEDDAWRRFMTQYVTSKVVEAEYSNRHEYGLPNDLNERQSNFHQRRRRGFVLTPKHRTRVNQKKYSTLFNFNAGPEWKVGGKPMKFEGFDTVEIEMEDENDKSRDVGEIESGKPVKRTQNVDDLMREAKRLLDQSDDEYTDIEDEPQTTPRRELPRRRQARPSHGRSRTNSDRSRSKERKKTQSKPAPKTMKELYERKNVMLPQQNRYRVSEFKDIKADLLKGSAELNRIAEAKKKKANLDKNNENEVEQAQPEKVETDNKKPLHNMETPPPSPDAKKILPQKDERDVKVTSTTTSNVVSETTKVTKAQTVKTETKDEVRNTSVETKNYLDDPETQMAIENAKDKPVNERKSPAKSEVTETKDDKDSQQFKEKPKASGLNNNDVSSSKVSLANSATNQNGHQRRMSKTSIVTTNGTHNKQNESPQRRVSKTTVVTTIETQNNDYQQSKTSLTSVNTAKDGSDQLDGSQRHVIPIQVKSDTQKDVERKSVAGSRVTLRDQKVTHTIQNGDVKSEHSENTVTQNKTKYPNGSTVTVSKSEEMVEVKTITSDKDKANNGPTVNGTVTNSNSITAETNSKNQTVRKTDDPPKINGHRSPSSEKQRRHSVVISNSKVPSVMKSVHVSENVTEKVNNKTIKSQNNKTRHQKGRIIARKSVENDPSLITQQMSYNDKNRTNILKSTTRNKESPSRGRHVATQPRSRSHTPNRSRKTSNPKHSDSRMSHEDYERKGSKTRQRDRKRSTSRERKRSVSRERRHSKQQTSKSRFPEIEKRDGRLSVVPFSEPKSERKVSVKEEEDTHEIDISSSKPAGAKQWKDLVSKYLRQPSPKVGKTEDRKLLETNLETDDDDDEIDIFERAKKRYLLNVSDDDSEDE